MRIRAPGALQLKRGVVRTSDSGPVTARRELTVLSLAFLLGCGEEWAEHRKAWSEDRKFYTVVRDLPVGTTEEDVLRQLGPPTDRGREFYLGQADGFETEYRAAAESASVRWLFWRRGLAHDVVCAVGFGADNRVAFRACGGT